MLKFHRIFMNFPFPSKIPFHYKISINNEISMKVETLLRIYAWRTATTIHDACLHFILQFGPVFYENSTF